MAPHVLVTFMPLLTDTKLTTQRTLHFRSWGKGLLFKSSLIKSSHHLVTFYKKILTGISTLQSSPPILQFICKAIFVATVMIVCGLLRVRASTHWLGMGQSVHRYFLMASYLSFRELDKIQTTFEEKRIFVRSCVLRFIQHLKSSLGNTTYAEEKYSNVHSERKNCKVSVL